VAEQGRPGPHLTRAGGFSGGFLGHIRLVKGHICPENRPGVPVPPATASGGSLATSTPTSAYWVVWRRSGSGSSADRCAVAVARAAGVPLGIAAGRWAWTLFADGLGVVAVPRVPGVAVGMVVVVALAVANLVAAAPADVAARTRPARVLRSE
jgi:hypothetical protein